MAIRNENSIYITVCVGWSKVFPNCGDLIDSPCKEEIQNIQYLSGSPCKEETEKIE